MLIRLLGTLASPALWKFNLTVHHVREINALRRQGHAYLQLFAIDLPLAHRLLDLTLRSYANFLQEFAN